MGDSAGADLAEVDSAALVADVPVEEARVGDIDAKTQAIQSRARETHAAACNTRDACRSEYRGYPIVQIKERYLGEENR